LSIEKPGDGFVVIAAMKVRSLDQRVQGSGKVGVFFRNTNRPLNVLASGSFTTDMGVRLT